MRAPREAVLGGNARAWLERARLASLRGRSHMAIERQLSDFRKQLRRHETTLKPFESRKGSVRFMIPRVEFRVY